MDKTRYNLADHPFVVLVTVLAAIIGIVIFISGIENLPDLYKIWFLSDLYDDFESTYYDGKVNPGLWEVEGNPRGEAAQLNGALIIQTNAKKQDGNFAVHAINPVTVSYQNFRYMEARVKLDNRSAGKGSFLKIQAVTY